MLAENVFPEIRGVMNGTEWTWQQDGATPHTAKETQQWLRESCPDCIMKNDWPSKSPDLNPMDYGIWGILSSKLAHMRRQLQSKDDLNTLLMTQWNEIS